MDQDFAEIYRRNIDTVYRLCYILLKNTADADDAVQSIFLKLLKHDKRLNGPEHEKAWLIVTTKNYCKDVLKSGWRSRRTDVEKLPEKTGWADERPHAEIIENCFLFPKNTRRFFISIITRNIP